MRVAAIDGRLCLGTDRGWVDVAVSSGHRFDADPQAAYDRWAEFTQWASGYSPNGEPALVRGEFGAPVSRPRQVFGAGLNYGDHAGEADLELPAARLTLGMYEPYAQVSRSLVRRLKSRHGVVPSPKIGT